MTTTVVRYQTRSERADDNEALIRDVVDALTGQQPDGLRYTVYRLADDTSVHIVETDEGSDDTALTGLAAFERFTGTIRERLAGGPVAQLAVRIGSYQPVQVDG